MTGEHSVLTINFYHLLPSSGNIMRGGGVNIRTGREGERLQSAVWGETQPLWSQCTALCLPIGPVNNHWWGRNSWGQIPSILSYWLLIETKGGGSHYLQLHTHWWIHQTPKLWPQEEIVNFNLFTWGRIYEVCVCVCVKLEGNHEEVEEILWGRRR